MAVNPGIPSSSFALLENQPCVSPRHDHGSAGIREDLPVLLGAAPQVFATPARGCFKVGSVPPAAANSLLKPPLLRALTARSTDKVRTDKVRMALEWDPEAACLPFWDHGLELPLCCAVRNDCCSDIIEMLLANGADASTADSRGDLPLTLLNHKIAHLEAPPPLAGIFEDLHFEDEDDLPGFLPMLTLPGTSAALEDKLRCRELLETALAA